MRLLWKGRTYDIGHVSHRKDGTFKKVGPKKWVRVGEGHKPMSRIDSILAQRLDDALTGFGAPSLAALETLEGQGIFGYEGLKEYIQTHSTEEVQSLALKVRRKVIDTAKELGGSPKPVLDPLTKVFVSLRNTFGQKKTRLMMQVPKETKGATTGRGGKKYKAKEPPLPVMQASTIQSANQKLGGWTLQGMPENAHLVNMAKTGAARLKRGKVKKDTPWEFRTDREQYITVPFRNADAITVSLVQQGYSSRAKKGKRKKVFAEIELDIPYARAEEWIRRFVPSVRTRNSLLGQLKRSAPYREFLEAQKPKAVGDQRTEAVA